MFAYQSGGDYAYIHEAFGALPAFLYLWAALLVIIPAGNAITALTFANYLLQPFWPECDPPVAATRLIAALVICKKRLYELHDSAELPFPGCESAAGRAWQRWQAGAGEKFL